MTWVIGGSFVGGLGAYLFQVVGARALGDEAFAPIGVLWTLQYLLMSIVLISVEANLTRTVTLAEGAPGALRRPLVTVTAWLGATAAITAAATFALRDAVFAGHGQLAAVAGLLVLTYGAYVTLRGWLAGMGRFRSYGAVTGLESVIRLGGALVVLSVWTTTTALAWVLPTGSAAVLVWWLRERRRPPEPEAPDQGIPPVVPYEAPSTARFLAATTTGNATAQFLLAAGPLALIPLRAGPAEISVFFVTVTAARVPLVFALNGLLSRLLPPFVRLASTDQHARLLRLAGASTAGTLVVAVASAAAAWWVGPALIRLFFGAAFDPPGWFVAVAVATVVVACGALVLNQMLIAMQAEARIVAPWLVALVAGVALVAVLPGAPTFRVALGFAAGELVALLGLVAVTARAAYRR